MLLFVDVGAFVLPSTHRSFTGLRLGRPQLRPGGTQKGFTGPSMMLQEASSVASSVASLLGSDAVHLANHAAAHGGGHGEAHHAVEVISNPVVRAILGSTTGWGLILVSVLLAIGQAYESGKEVLEHSVPKSMKPVIGGLVGELSTLGVVGLLLGVFQVHGEDSWLSILSTKYVPACIPSYSVTFLRQTLSHTSLPTFLPWQVPGRGRHSP